MSVVVGVCIGLVFMMLGLFNVGVWGLVVGVINFVFYVGVVVLSGGVVMVVLV